MKDGDLSYTATAFHPNFGSEAASGKIIIDFSHFRFESDWGHVEIPLNELQIELNDDDPRAFFNHPQQSDWSICTPDQHILQHRVFAQRTHLRNQLRAVQERKEGVRRLIITLVCLGAFGILALLFNWISSWGVHFLVARVPISWEENVGESLFAQVKAEEAFVQDPKQTADLKALTVPLLRALPKNSINFRFHIVKDPEPNAFALPGGHVIVNTGLLDLAERPEEIAGVLAHEIAHVTQRHALRQRISDAGPFVVMRLLFHDQRGLLAVVGIGSEILLHQTFSRDYEREADETGWKYLVAANIDPSGFIDCLKKLKKDIDQQGLAQLEHSAFSSHPPTEERIQRLERKWKKLKHQTGFVDLSKPEP